MNQRIRYFLKAAESRSFSKAAEQLYISPQALTKQITVLEDELGGKLFDRSHQGTILTQFGAYAYQKLQALETDYCSTINDLKIRAKDQKPRINIGIFSALPREKIVSPLVSFLLASYPEYQISLDLIELDEGRRALGEGKIDLLLTNIHEEDDLKDCRALVFEEHPAEVVVSLVHPWAIRNTVTREDMEQETFLKMVMDDRHYTVPAAQSFYGNIPCKSVKYVSNFETMLVLMGQGEGFAVMPMAFHGLEDAKVKSFPFPGKTEMFYTALVYNLHNPLQGLGKIVEDLRDEFDLAPIPAERWCESL